MPILDQTSALRRVYVRPPEPEAGRRWREYGWRAEPDPARAAAEHEAFRAQLAAAGADVVVGTTAAPGDPDAIYAYDPVLMTPAGAILLRPAKPGRRGEPEVAAADLAAAGVPTVGALGAPGRAEGGDLCWLDRGTLLAGVGYRTSAAGVDALRSLLPDVTVHAFDLPHFTGPDACTHLLSFLSILDVDLAVASLPHLPVRLVQLLRERGVEIVEVPPEELDSMGPNVLALGPAGRAGARRATTRRGDGSRPPASTCGPTRARRSPARATAARRASRCRSIAADDQAIPTSRSR